MIVAKTKTQGKGKVRTSYLQESKGKIKEKGTSAKINTDTEQGHRNIKMSLSRSQDKGTQRKGHNILNGYKKDSIEFIHEQRQTYIKQQREQSH